MSIKFKNKNIIIFSNLNRLKVKENELFRPDEIVLKFAKEFEDKNIIFEFNENISSDL